jgi:hypothetical protein
VQKLSRNGSKALLNGIHRDVLLYVKEAVFISDYIVTTTMPEKEGGSASLAVEVFVHEAVTWWGRCNLTPVLEPVLTPVLNAPGFSPKTGT